MIVRTDADLTNAIHYHWGGVGTNDVFKAIKANMWGRRIYVMGYTNSFHKGNDYDAFMIRVNKDLEIEHIKMLINDNFDEFLHSIVISPRDNLY